jgi:hypothetical protein
MAAQKAGDLRLDSVRQQRSRAVAQNFDQRFGKSSWLAELENVSIGVSFAGEVEASNTPTIRRLTPFMPSPTFALVGRSFVGLSLG